MRIFRNGVLAYDETAGDDFDDGQLSQISLAMSAIDAEVGMGSIAVPGDPGWVAGDRISVYEGGPVGDTDVVFGGIPVTFGGIQVVWTNNGPWGEYLIYTGYVGQHSRIRNPSSPLELTSIYQVMDVNRQLIGRRVVDYFVVDTVIAGQTAITAHGLLQDFADQYLSDLDLDLTYFDADTTPMQPQTYNSDGIMDIVGTIVLNTGSTVYLSTTQTENQFYYNFHPLTTGPTAGLGIDETPGVFDYVTVFPPMGPEYRADPADLKNVIEARNGLITVQGDNPSSITTYDAGGLKWEAAPSYSVSEDSLVTYVNNQLSGAVEQITYSCTIGPLDGSQIVQIPVGSFVFPVTATVFGGAITAQRIVRLTLTPAQGNTVAPGLWDAHLELATPVRLPANSLNYGGQGGYYGHLTDPFNNIDHYQPVSGGQFVASDIPVGGTYRINYQMVDITNTPLTIPGDTATFTLEMWQDVDESIPGDGWSISIPSGGDVSDVKGQVYVDLSHDTAGSSIVVNVVCSR